METPALALFGSEFQKTWKSFVAHYQKPDRRRSLWQVANSLLPYFLLWGLMAWSVSISYWLTLGLAILAAGFLVRIFIIFHDCGHGSFFKSHKANEIVGIITGLITFTAFYSWSRDHAIHHASAGDLDRRGVGDVQVLTVEEYRALSPLRRLAYRIMRNPFVMFVIGAPLVFLIAHRFPRPGSGRREIRSVLWTDLALAMIILTLVLLLGWKTVLLVQLPILMLGTTVGVWMFYVQHQYQGVYWRRHGEWDYLSAALTGASYYHLPRLLQWFTGNIGFHHLHHLAPRIPNYNLEKCQRENPIFHSIQPLTLLTSLHALRLRLYDEQNRRMIGWRELPEISEAS